jgi:ubiquitin thioesterase protein OTUB1
MSLSKLSWNHFGPHHPFPEKQKFHGCYQDALAPPDFLRPLGLSISAAFAPGPSTMSNSSNMNTLSPDEMQRFQKLSNEFEPDVPVGDLRLRLRRTVRLSLATGTAGLPETIKS